MGRIGNGSAEPRPAFPGLLQKANQAGLIETNHDFAIHGDDGHALLSR
jgi:hypothetical protein